jgi:hypothetical protein
MKLSDWASVAEIVSGVAVVITLLFLIIGIQENTETTRASMYADSIRDLNYVEHAGMVDPEFSRILDAFLSGQTAELSEQDRSQMNRIVATYSRIYDMAYSMQRYGLFGGNEWERFDRFICGNYQRAINAGMEDTFLTLGSDEFQGFVKARC